MVKKLYKDIQKALIRTAMLTNGFISAFKEDGIYIDEYSNSTDMIPLGDDGIDSLIDELICTGFSQYDEGDEEFIDLNGVEVGETIYCNLSTGCFIDISNVYVNEFGEYTDSEGNTYDEDFRLKKTLSFENKKAFKGILKEITGREYKNIQITKVLGYDLNVIGGMLENLTLRPDKDDSITIGCYFNEEVQGMLDRFAPFKLEGVSKWSNPGVAKEFYAFLLKNIFTGKENLKGYSYALGHICMLDGELAYITYTIEGKKIIRYAKDNLLLAKKLLELVGRFEKPIKEIFVVANYLNGKGEYVAKKNNDGEYTITLY